MSDRIAARHARRPARGWAAARRVEPAVARWEPRYRRKVIISDVTATLLVVLLGGIVQLLRHPSLDVAGMAGLQAVTVLVVVCSLYMSRVWNPIVLGQGAEEFGRLGRGLFAAVVALGLGALAGGIPGTRVWVFVVVPAIAIVAFPQRYLLRRLLHRARNDGRCLLPVLAAGNVDSVRDLIDRTRAAAHLGWRVEAACTLDGRGTEGTEVDGVPVIGELGDLAELLRRGGYRIVAVTPDRYWTPKKLQQLAWSIEGTGAEMVVSSGLMEITGPRLHVNGVLGMPMLWVSEPAFSGFPRVVKGIADRVGAAILLALLLPLLSLVAVLVVLDSDGPVFYRQRRVGKDGFGFTMIKFRTMVTGADALRTGLAGTNDATGPLFKMRTDPRVTRVGTWLRRYSIDELPQLCNVLLGSMSLVGPRPPLPDETASYEPHVRRRLLVKPGLTGLWQVSGRSDLSWEDTVRLDLRYVEDWSLAMDALILWKTMRAVLSGAGAY